MENTLKILVIAFVIFCLLLLPTWFNQKTLGEENARFESDCEKKCTSKDMDYRFKPEKMEIEMPKRSFLINHRFSPSKCECISDF
jgi:hypothetical protein